MLIEAGGRDWNPLIHIPAGYIKLMDHPRLTWGFKAEPDPGVNGREILYRRGRVLGGSSSINGLIYIRGQPEDFDHWAQLGNRGWGWDEVLPLFRKSAAIVPNTASGVLSPCARSEARSCAKRTDCSCAARSSFTSDTKP